MHNWHLTSRVALLAKWLPAHASLVGEITLRLPPHQHNTGPGYAMNDALDSLLGLSMQQIIAASCSAGSAAPHNQQQRPPFALRSFSSSAQHSAEVLSALPAATLAGLMCPLWKRIEPDGRVVVPAASVRPLAGLTSLRCMDLDCVCEGSLLSSVAALTQLTSLRISELNAWLEQLQQLPASLVRLEIPYLWVNTYDDEADVIAGGAAAGDDADDNAEQASAHKTPQLSLSHLTRLTHLSLQLWDLCDKLHISGQLPPQLLELYASADNQSAVLPLLGGASALQQLQRLSLGSCWESEEDLLALNSLSALTHISLQYHEKLEDVQGVSTWGQLSQLRSLHVASLGGPGNDLDAGTGLGRSCGV
jgi:hypothetical protein